MKYVAKGGEPHEMLNWKRHNKTTPHNLIFGNIPRQAVRAALMQKQGWLCGYTMHRLDGIGACHIEHMLPQAHYEHESINFDNFLACYPTDGGANIGFGAPAKGGRFVSKADFVFPNEIGCEVKFEFRQNGRVYSEISQAQNTICILNLNHDDLVTRRLAIFRELGLTSRPGQEGRYRRKLATSHQANATAARMSIRDATGKFEEFCVAIAQVATLYATRLDKLSQRLRNKPA